MDNNRGVGEARKRWRLYATVTLYSAPIGGISAAIALILSTAQSGMALIGFGFGAIAGAAVALFLCLAHCVEKLELAEVKLAIASLIFTQHKLADEFERFLQQSKKV